MTLCDTVICEFQVVHGGGVNKSSSGGSMGAPMLPNDGRMHSMMNGRSSGGPYPSSTNTKSNSSSYNSRLPIDVSDDECFVDVRTQ